MTLNGLCQYVILFSKPTTKQTRMPCSGRETARCRCKIRYVRKFIAASLGFPCDSTAFLLFMSGTQQCSNKQTTGNSQQPLGTRATMTYEELDVNPGRPVSYQQLHVPTAPTAGHERVYYNSRGDSSNININSPYEHCRAMMHNLQSYNYP